MKLNASKTKTMIISRSITMHPQSPALTIGITMLKESDDLVILGVTFDSKMTFEKHLQYLCGTILVTPYSTVWDWRVSRAGPMTFYWDAARFLFVSSCFPFLFFHSMGWYCGAGVFGLIGC